MLSLYAGSSRFSPPITFARDEWARLRASTPLTLTEADLAKLQGINERISLGEVCDVFLPLSRLLNLHVVAYRRPYLATSVFLGRRESAPPFIIGIAGSVAVGKSTTARVLQAILARWPGHPRVDLVATDGFLYPNRVLEERGLLNRKGFPESYDVRRLVRFLADLKAGLTEVAAPVYSHLTYDIVPGEQQVVRRPDIVIVEGLNVLQRTPRQGSGSEPSPAYPRSAAPVFVSDFFNFSIYVDAEEFFILRWYVERFLTLVKTAFRDPSSYFHRYASLTIEEAVALAEAIWNDINGPNLRTNILPTRERAHLVLEKGPAHSVQQIKLYRLYGR